MSETTPVLKCEQNQQLIPNVWHGNILAIAEAIRNKDITKLNGINDVKPLSEEEMIRIQNNILDYGCQLDYLPDDTWNSSVCQWILGYWDVIVDLYTVEEGLSDLALSLRVYESGARYNFEVMSVHVA